MHGSFFVPFGGVKMRAAAMQTKRKIKGFTLTETLVVVAVLVILAAFAAPNLIQNWKQLQITELDGTARQIFLAAQNDLMDQKTSGQLVTLAAKSTVVQSKQVTEGASTKTLYYIESGTAQSDLTRTAALLSTLSGSYVLYLDPASGDVTDVYYSKDALTQADVEALHTDGDDAELRAEEGIGYYGGLKVSSAGAIHNETEHPQETLELVNGEDLYARLVYPNLGQAFTNPERVLATVTVSDQHANTVTLTADGDSALGSTVPASVYASVDTDNGYTLYILLDSQVSGCSFPTLYPNLTAGDDITLTASLTYSGTPVFQNAVIGTTNSLFAAKYSSTVTQNGITHRQGVEFAYARQLSNLRFYSLGAGSAVQTADIDYTKDASHRLKTMMPVAAHLNAAPDTFTPVSLTDTQSGITIDGEDGRGTLHTLSNFRISGTDSVGLIGSCTVSAEIQNLRLKDFTVSGRAGVGALIGKLQSDGAATVKNCGVYQSAAGAGSVSGGKGASSDADTPTGGLIGIMQAKNGDRVTVENCFSAVDVANSQQQAGGLIGKISGGTTAVPVKILSSYASGSTAAGTAGAYRAVSGGLIGAAGDTVTVASCFSSADVYGSASCGGLVGSNTGTLSATGSYACGTVITGGKVTYGPLVNGSGTAAYTNCRYLNQTGDPSASDAYSGAAPAGVIACEYDDLTKSAAGTAISNRVSACHPYRSDLQGTAYPFGMVADEYYGDWPERYAPIPKITAPYGLCYYEKYSDSNGAVSWGFYGYGKTGELCDSLDYLNIETITFTGYGVLVPSGTVGVSAPTLGWKEKTATFGSTIEITAAGVDLYPISNAETQLMTHDNQYNRAAIDKQAGRTLYINPHFAAALSLTELRRSSDDPIQIRTENQLRNRGLISDTGWYFKQTHNISVTKADTGKYLNNTDCTFDGSENYIVGLKAPLLQKSIGSVKNIRLTDVAISQSSDAAALAVLNQGTIQNCQVLSGSVTSTGGNAGGLVCSTNGGMISNSSVGTAESTAAVAVKGVQSTGGLVADVTGSGNKITNCQVLSGSVTSTGGNAGGLVCSINGGMISDSSVGTAGSAVPVAVKGAQSTGGLVAVLTGSGNKITNCGVLNSSITNTSSSNYAAGLVGESAGVEISSCSVESSVGITSSGGKAAGFVGLNKSDSIIEQSAAQGTLTATNGGSAAGFVNYNNGGTIKLSYSTDVISAQGGGYASGFVDTMNGGTVDSSYYSGTVSSTGANSTATGFCRSISQGKVSNCFAVGTVSVVTGTASGFANTVSNWDGSVSNCYAAMQVTAGNGTTAGFTQDNVNAYLNWSASPDRYTNCYWVKQAGFNHTVSSPDVAGKVMAISFDQLRALNTLGTSWTLTTTAEQTHPVSAALSGKAYPYPRILGLDFYGDWPY